jgi:A/G-specific adenine glycosylase
VLDLGATICVKRSPRCGVCPVRDHCAWVGAGQPEPDPAEGTAGASTPQSRFDGSDRQGRGRIVQALRTGPVDVERIADVAGWPEDPERARRVADGLVGDGLAEYADGCLALPA